MHNTEGARALWVLAGKHLLCCRCSVVCLCWFRLAIHAPSWSLCSCPLSWSSVMWDFSWLRGRCCAPWRKGERPVLFLLGVHRDNTGEICSLKNCCLDSGGLDTSPSAPNSFLLSQTHFDSLCCQLTIQWISICFLLYFPGWTHFLSESASSAGYDRWRHKWNSLCTLTLSRWQTRWAKRPTG